MSHKVNRPDNLTPLFQQYFDAKDKYPDCLLLFRVGDFYELYGQDAVIGSQALEIALTYREVGKGQKLEMAGVPYHALDNYLKQLIHKGFKVAVGEQLEDARFAKGLVKRDVTRVVTSGTVLDPDMLPGDENNFIISISGSTKFYGVSLGDMSTGEMRITRIESDDLSYLLDEIFRTRPGEALLSLNLKEGEKIREYLKELQIPFSMPHEENPYESGERDKIIEEVKNINTSSPCPIKWEEMPETLEAVLLLLKYLNKTQKTQHHSLQNIEYYDISRFMILDSTTWRNLELSHTMSEHKKKGSLLWVIDHTRTGMGARLLRAWLEKPLLDIKEINVRLDAVEEIFSNYTLMEGLGNSIKQIYDLERITSRIIYRSANARDMLCLRNSLSHLPALKEFQRLVKSSLLSLLLEEMDPLEDVHSLIAESIAEEPSSSLKEGNIIKEGFNAQLDELRHIRYSAKQWIAEMEQQERESTGIKSLKVKFNSVFGYFIEITKSNLHLVPDTYVRKQTIANGERFISPQLKEYESKVLGAEEKINDIEYELFIGIRDAVAKESARIQYTARIVANIDCLLSLAHSALSGRFTRPQLVKERILQIRGGRHPVVEKVLGSDFVPNDTLMDEKKNRFHIITGPNMSGKSTYLRQVGLINILAQIGSFVPAQSAVIGIADRIFTRVGASDDLHQGKSTFLVEMSETANIIKNASIQSLILLDEIGRGTSTFDGLSIAWSVSEYINRLIKARCLFATHFHELTRLEEKWEGIKNYRVDVKETHKEIIFLHRIVPGGTDKSYGIYVAKLAGLPPKILQRAKEILDQLENGQEKEPGKKQGKSKPAYQLTFFDLLSSPLLDDIKNTNPDKLSPREALEKIYQWKNQIN